MHRMCKITELIKTYCTFSLLVSEVREWGAGRDSPTATQHRAGASAGISAWRFRAWQNGSTHPQLCRMSKGWEMDLHSGLGSRGCPQLQPSATDNRFCLWLRQEQDLAPQTLMAVKSQLLLSLGAASLDLNARFFFGDLIFEMLGIKFKNRQTVAFDFGGGNRWFI